MICKADPSFWTPRQEAIHCIYIYIYVKITTKKRQKQIWNDLKGTSIVYRHDLGECLSCVPYTSAASNFSWNNVWSGRILHPHFCPNKKLDTAESSEGFQAAFRNCWHAILDGMRMTPKKSFGPLEIGNYTSSNWTVNLTSPASRWMLISYSDSIIASPLVRKPATERPTQNDPNMIKCAIYRKHSLIFWEFLRCFIPMQATQYCSTSRDMRQFFFQPAFWELYHQGVLVKRGAPEISDHRTISHLISIHWMETSTVWRCGELVP